MNAPALRQLYSLMCAVPAQEISLNTFYLKNGDCVWGCGLGYAAHFGLCGMYLETGLGLPACIHPESGEEYRGIEAAIPAFGITRAESLELFCAANKSRYDQPGSDHKQMWLNRMESFFNEKGLSLEEPKQEAPEYCVPEGIHV